LSSVFRNLTGVRLLLLLLLIASWPSVAGAQSVVDGRRVEFTPSVDHDVVETDGTAVVSSYSLQFFVAGGVTPVETVDLGKPAPDSDGFIRVDFVALLTTPPAAGTLYEVIVSAVGPGGTGASARSNTVSFSQTCSPSISPASQSVAAAGASGSSTVTAAPGCAWTAASNVTWITLTAGATGTGTAAVNFTTAANTATTSRVGTLTIAGSTFTVTQAAATCSFSISPTSQSVAASGATGSVAVTTTSGCAWTSVSGASWVTVTSGASRSGSGSTGFTVAANTATTARSATLTIAGKTFTVNQAAACSYTVTPVSVTAATAGVSGTIAVVTQSACAWSGSSPVGWITLTGAGPGNGNASYTVAANTGTVPRTATLTVAGTSVVVTQAPRPKPPANLRFVR
jgi:hypothetical protein